MIPVRLAVCLLRVLRFLRLVRFLSASLPPRSLGVLAGVFGSPRIIDHTTWIAHPPCNNTRRGAQADKHVTEDIFCANCPSRQKEWAPAAVE